MVYMIDDWIIVRVWNVSECYQSVWGVGLWQPKYVEYDHLPLLAIPVVLFEYFAFAVYPARLGVSVLPNIHASVQRPYPAQVAYLVKALIANDIQP